MRGGGLRRGGRARRGAERPRRAKGQAKLEPRSSVSWRKGPSEPEAGSDRAGRRGASGVGRVVTGSREASPPPGSLRAQSHLPAHSGSLFRVLFLLWFRELARALETQGRHQPELGCAVREPGVRDDPKETYWREAGSRTPSPPPPPPAAPVAGLLASSPTQFSWAYLPPGSPRWGGESGAIEAGAPAGRCRPCSLGAPSDRQLNR